MKEVRIRFPARPYQQRLIEHFRGGGRRAMGVWHRRAGKDRVATFIESELAFKRVGLYWHALPEYRHARRVIWDNITRDGQRLLDVNFPAAIIRKRHEQDMKLELINGSIWQLVGADNFDALVGSNPVHVTFSEFALMHPKAREFVRPILAENDGTELIITTPRGYNHAHDLWQYAKGSPLWHTSLLTVADTGVIPAEVLDEERRSMPDELFRQEYECDWSAANVGAILGRYIEAAERDLRIGECAAEDGPVEISSDIGFRDTAAWWFWQRQRGGWALVDYDEDTGLDAGDWIERLQAKPYDIKRVWLPHDAKAKTFQSKHSVVEQFARGFGSGRIRVVPQTRIQDRINAARVVLRACRFDAERCKDGLAGLRAWSYTFDEERHCFSKDPLHDWASHPGDAFSYGAQVMRDEIKEEPAPRGKVLQDMSLNDLWDAQKALRGGRI